MHATPEWPETDQTLLRTPSLAPRLTLEVAEAKVSGPRYADEEVLGRGGMGLVQSVADRLMARRVAMKVMHPEVAATHDGRSRFLREARVQGVLEHPSIVPVYELGEDAAGVPYFTMRRVRGLTLEQVLAALASGQDDARARFPRRRLLSAFVQVCLALDYAHTRGILHRDLKPGNLMLGDFGEVHVLDWGLAQVGQERGPATDLAAAMEQAARGGSVFGTPGYMAPEQARGDSLDASADVYALGTILFEVLALKAMNDGLPSERLRRTLEGTGRSPRLAAPDCDVPPELDAAVLAATDPDPSKRLGSARLLAEQVEHFLDGDRDGALRKSLAERHVAQARATVADLDASSAADRKAAVSQLLGALALDPTHAEGLTLLRRTLTHVPAVLPADALRSREESHGAARAALSRSIALRLCVWAALLPLGWAMGPVNAPMAWCFSAVVAIAAGAAAVAGRRATLSCSGLFGVLAVTSLPMLCAASLFGSLVLVPCLAATALVMTASHVGPRARLWSTAATVAMTLGPFLLEQLGVIPTMWEFTGDTIVIHSGLVNFPPVATKLMLGIATLSAVAMPGVLAGRLRDRLARAEDRVLMTAWHLDSLGGAPLGAPTTR